MLLEQLNKILKAYGFENIRDMDEIKEEIEELFSFKEPAYEQDFITEMLSYLTQIPFGRSSRLKDIELFISKSSGSESSLKQEKWWLEKLSVSYNGFGDEFELDVEKESMDKMMGEFFVTEMEDAYKKHFGEEVYNSIHLKKVFEPERVDIEVWWEIKTKTMRISEDEDVKVVLEQMKGELSEVLKKIYPFELEKHAERQKIRYT